MTGGGLQEVLLSREAVEETSGVTGGPGARHQVMQRAKDAGRRGAVDTSEDGRRQLWAVVRNREGAELSGLVHSGPRERREAAESHTVRAEPVALGDSSDRWVQAALMPAGVAVITKEHLVRRTREETVAVFARRVQIDWGDRRVNFHIDIHAVAAGAVGNILRDCLATTALKSEGAVGTDFHDAEHRVADTGRKRVGLALTDVDELADLELTERRHVGAGARGGIAVAVAVLSGLEVLESHRQNALQNMSAFDEEGDNFTGRVEVKRLGEAFTDGRWNHRMAAVQDKIRAEVQ